MLLTAGVINGRHGTYGRIFFELKTQRFNCCILAEDPAKLAASNGKTFELERVRNCGGKVLFGPSYDEGGRLHYGGSYNIEGNQLCFIQG